jgi:hypothetical protein
MVAAAIGDELLWVRLPWLPGNLSDAGSVGATVSPRYLSVATTFNPSVNIGSGNPWSIAFWCARKGSQTAAQYILGVAGAPRFYVGWGVALTNSLVVGIDGTPVNIFSGNMSPAVDVVFHTTITFNGINQLLVYRDGVLEATTTTTSGSNLPNIAIAIGAQAGGNLNTQWQGALDDVRIYNRVLTAGESATLASSAPSVPTGGPAGFTGIRGVSRRLGT